MNVGINCEYFNNSLSELLGSYSFLLVVPYYTTDFNN